MKKRAYYSLVLGLLAAACKHDPQELPPPTCASVTYTGQVKPILQQNCMLSGCHNANSPNGDFNKFEDLKNLVTNGSFKNSVIDWNAPRMPETHKLSDEGIRLLQCWLNQGAPNN